ncbi:hypothetical protein HPB51_007099 [Rhipicephalus microplus]|uniref:Uncharacterized protein n=1 Tax=Rhipicephalus microplus TaxID=6941 RepID=A0A9J6DZX3_RHIMP|nr:hypothetical protein HPB51_007099 [Rhipicephalus microplus]
MELILAHSAFGARLQCASGVRSPGVGGDRQQLPSEREIIGKDKEMSSVAPNSVTTTVSILKSSPPPPYSSELHIISAEAPSSEDDRTCNASRTPRVRPAQRVRFSDVEGRWIYDADEQTLPVRPDTNFHDRECQRSTLEWTQRPNSMFACTLISLLCFFTLVLLFQLFTPAMKFIARQQKPLNGTRV